MLGSKGWTSFELGGVGGRNEKRRDEAGEDGDVEVGKTMVDRCSLDQQPPTFTQTHSLPSASLVEGRERRQGFAIGK